VTEVLVACSLGVALVDVEEEAATLTDVDHVPARAAVETGLPLVRDVDAAASTVVAAVDRRPPLVVSHDAGATWTESGAGLPPGVAVAISPEHPDHILFATDERLFLSLDGGRFWRALAVELPGITAVRWVT
jgi:photosystem II stability/assembly factor-like uncharacterized protein